MRWSDRSNSDFAQARRVSQLAKRYVKEGIYEIKAPSGAVWSRPEGEEDTPSVKTAAGSALTPWNIIDSSSQQRWVAPQFKDCDYSHRPRHAK